MFSSIGCCGCGPVVWLWCGATSDLLLSLGATQKLDNAFCLRLCGATQSRQLTALAQPSGATLGVAQFFRYYLYPRCRT